MAPEGFSPLTVIVIKGKGNAKVSVDICGACFASFTGKTAQESGKRLEEHVASCPKYRAFKN